MGTLALHFDNDFSCVFSSEQSLESFHHVVEPLCDVLTMFKLTLEYNQ